MGPLIAALIALAAEGAKYAQGQHAASSAKKERHKYRDFLGQQADKFSAQSPLIVGAEREAERTLKGGMRARGTYSPDVVAGRLASMKTKLGQNLQALKSNLDFKSAAAYFDRPKPVAPAFDVGGAASTTIGLMGMGQNQDQNKANEFNRQAYQRPTMGRDYNKMFA